MLTKINLHASRVTLYMHEFFEPILFFDPHGLHGLENVTKFDGKQISKTVEPTHTTCMSATYTCMSLTVTLTLLKQHSQAALQF